MLSYPTSGVDTMTVEEAERELKELEPVMQRIELLQKFVALGKQLAPVVRGGVELTLATGAGRNDTARLAFEVLAAHGDMRVPQLLDHMQKLGWRSSGDTAKDQKAVYAALLRKPNLFVNDEGNWSASEGTNK